jgi:hypothetical protein
MKKKWLFIPILTIIFIFTLLPISYLNADPSNYVKNGNFSNGLTDWSPTGSVWSTSGTAYMDSSGWSYILQDISTNKKNLKLSLDVEPTSYSGGYIGYGFNLYKNSIGLGGARVYSNPQLHKWTKIDPKISDMWHDYNGTSIPDFDTIEVWVGVNNGETFFDNIKLAIPEENTEATEQTFVRTLPLTCYEVWVNKDGNFEFVFMYPYADNNWVKIYDMTGKEVFNIDMPNDNPHFIANLPDGMYWVKTFTVGSANPIQTFLIGKSPTTPHQDLTNGGS